MFANINRVKKITKMVKKIYKTKFRCYNRHNKSNDKREVGNALMTIRYKNSKDERMCNDFMYAKKQLPTVVAEKLLAHINYIEQAANFADIIEYQPFHFHKLHNNRKDEYSLDIGRKLGYRIIIEPLDENNQSLKKEKDINVIKNCTKIVLVLEITNHYDKRRI